MKINFIASNKLEFSSFEDIEKFVDDFPDFQAIELKDEHELNLLLEQMGIGYISPIELKSSAFSKLWNLSEFKFPELSNEEFDQFYTTWIQNSNRSNNMDEYGSLIFLQGLSPKWNKMNYRFIVKEK